MLSITSAAFEAGGIMPTRFAMKAAGGGNVSPPYEWRDAPAGTASIALLVVDAHPIARGWVHWAVANIPGNVTELAAGASGLSMPAGAVELANTFGSPGWGGPQPPPGTGNHDYRATVYALDVASLNVAPGAPAGDLTRAMQGHILEFADVSGYFGR